MPTNTSNAIGVAKQFTPQEPQTYQRRLQGLQTNYNIFAQKDYNSETLATGMKALGVAYGDYTNFKDEQDLKIAQALAPEAYKNNQNRHKLKAVEMLANVGGYDLSDNPYAVGIIDKLRGAELNNKINADYHAYRENKKLAGTAEEELQSYEQFYQNALDEYKQDNNSVSNQYAFDSGLHHDRLENTQTVYNAYHQDKNKELYRDRLQGFQSQIDKLARDWQYSKLTKEERAPIFMDIMSKINITQGHDADTETKLLQTFMEKMASTGNRDVLDELGDYQAFNGKFVKDIVSPTAYYDLANKYGAQIRNDQFTSLMDELKKLNTEEGVNKYFEELKANNPEKAKQVAPYIPGRIDSIKAEQRARMAQMKKSVDMGALSTLVQNVVQGRVDRPTSARELRNFGDGAQETYIQLGLETAGTLLSSGDTTGYVNLMMDNVIGKPLRENLTRQIKTSLANGKMDDALRMGLHFLDDNLKHQAPNLLGDTYADMVSLNNLIAVSDEQSALATMAKAYVNKQDKTVYDSVKSTVRGTTLDANLYSTGSDTDDYYYNFTIHNTTQAYSEFTNLAETFMLAGDSPSNSLERARAIMKDNYVVSADCIYPKWAYNKMQYYAQSQGVEGLNHAIGGTISEMRNYFNSWSTTEVTFEQNGSDYQFRVRDINNPAVEKVFTQDEVEGYLKGYA